MAPGKRRKRRDGKVNKEMREKREKRVTFGERKGEIQLHPG